MSNYKINYYKEVIGICFLCGEQTIEYFIDSPLPFQLTDPNIIFDNGTEGLLVITSDNKRIMYKNMITNATTNECVTIINGNAYDLRKVNLLKYPNGKWPLKESLIKEKNLLFLL